MQTIIITTDFSATSRNAARYAAAWGEALEINHMVLYHAYDDSAVVSEIPLTEADISQVHAQSLEALEDLEKEVRTVLKDNAKMSIDLVANGSPLVLGV